MKLRSFSESDYESYVRFVDNNFGKGSYQSNLDYLRWLYLDNPFEQSYKNFLLLVGEAGEVLGCMHKLVFFTDNERGETVRWVSVHNLMLDEEYRNGAGLLFLQHLRKSESRFIIPGVTGRLKKAYERLGCVELDNIWYRKFMPGGLFRWIFGGLIGSHCKVGNRFGEQFNLIEGPKISEILKTNPFCELLSPTFHDWRFRFSGKCSYKLMFSKESKSFLLFVVGKRKNIPVTRILFGFFADQKDEESLLANVLSYSKYVGSFVVIVSGNLVNASITLEKLAFKRYSPRPSSLIYHKGSLEKKSINKLWPLVSDLGLEEIFSI